MSLYGKEKGVKVEGGFRGYLVFRRLHQFPYMGKIPRQTLLRSRPRYLTPPNGLFPRGSLSAFEILSAFFPLSKDFSASPMHALCRGRKEKKKKREKKRTKSNASPNFMDPTYRFVSCFLIHWSSLVVVGRSQGPS